jgi:hypothetical protein
MATDDSTSAPVRIPIALAQKITTLDRRGVLRLIDAGILHVHQPFPGGRKYLDLAEVTRWAEAQRRG